MADTLVKTPAEMFEKPHTPPSAGQTGPLFFTMPPEYRHGGVGKAIHVPKTPISTLPPPVAVLPKPSAAGPSAPTLKKPSTISRPLLIGGSIFLVCLLIGAGAIIFWPKKPVPVVTAPRPVPPVTRPVVETPPEPTPVPEPPKETPSPFPAATVPGTDTDSDGLTDLEERTIYGTDPRLPDSDSDGFLDGNEVFHRYNPNGTAPGTLLESGLVRAFAQAAIPANALPATRVLYPAGWSTTGEYPEVQFKAVTGEIVTYMLLVKDTPEQTLLAWKELHGVKDLVVPFTTKNGYTSLVAENQLTAYVDLGSSVAVFAYSTGIKGTVDYLQSFQMMTNSLEIIP